VPIVQTGDFADASAQYVTELKSLADDRRRAAENQAKLLTANAYNLAPIPPSRTPIPSP